MGDEPGPEAWKEGLKLTLAEAGHDVSDLVDALFESNQSPIDITVASSRAKGYVIQTERQFAVYDLEDGSWDVKKFYRDHPKASGRMWVSVPAYDAKTGLVLVWISRSADFLASDGGIYVYRLEDGQLREVTVRILFAS